MFRENSTCPSTAKPTSISKPAPTASNWTSAACVSVAPLKSMPSCASYRRSWWSFPTCSALIGAYRCTGKTHRQRADLTAFLTDKREKGLGHRAQAFTARMHQAPAAVQRQLRCRQFPQQPAGQLQMYGVACHQRHAEAGYYTFTKGVQRGYLYRLGEMRAFLPQILFAGLACA